MATSTTALVWRLGRAVHLTPVKEEQTRTSGKEGLYFEDYRNKESELLQ